LVEHFYFRKLAKEKLYKLRNKEEVVFKPLLVRCDPLLVVMALT